VRILQRYLAARFLGLFAAFLVGSILTIVLVEMLLNFDNILRAQEGLPGVVRYLFLRIPSYYLRDLIPLTAFAATFATLAITSRWLEALAIKAGGISPQRVVLPILLIGVLLAAATLVLSETAVLRATRQWNRRAIGSSDPITFRWGSFWYHRGHTIYNIMDANRDERTLRGVKIWEVDERGQLLRSIRADRVVIQPDGEWRFHNSWIHRMDPANILTPPVFERLPGEAAIQLTDTTDAALMSADAAALPLYELRQYVEARRREGDPAVQLETVFHRRLTDPLAVVIFVLLAIPLGLQVEQTRSIGLPALEGIGTLALFFLLRNTGGTLAVEGILLPGTLPWTVITLFAGWAAWRFYRVSG